MAKRFLIDDDIRRAAIIGYQAKLDEINAAMTTILVDEQIKQPKKRSAAARKRMAAAQKKRWAKAKK